MTKRTLLLIALAATAGAPALAACSSTQSQAPLPPPATVQPYGTPVPAAPGGDIPGAPPVAAAPRSGSVGANAAPPLAPTGDGLRMRPGYAPDQAPNQAAPSRTQPGSSLPAAAGIPVPLTGPALPLPGPTTASSHSSDAQIGTRAPWATLLADQGARPAPTRSPADRALQAAGPSRVAPGQLKRTADATAPVPSLARILTDPAARTVLVPPPVAAPGVVPGEPRPKKANPKRPRVPKPSQDTGTHPTAATAPAATLNTPETPSTAAQQQTTASSPYATGCTVAGPHPQRVTGETAQPTHPGSPTSSPHQPSPHQPSAPQTSPHQPGQPKPDKPKSDQAKQDQTKSDQTKPTQAEPADPTTPLTCPSDWAMAGLVLPVQQLPAPVGPDVAPPFRKALMISLDARPDTAGPDAAALQKWAATLERAASLAPDHATSAHLRTLAGYVDGLSDVPVAERADAQLSNYDVMAKARDLRASLPACFGVDLLG